MKRLSVNDGRGKVLLAFATIHFGTGSYVLALQNFPMSATGIAGPLPFIREIGLPIWAAAVPWFATAIIASVAAFVKPIERDAFGYIALVAMQSGWSLVYIVGWFMGARGPATWFLALTFAALAYAVKEVSGMISADVVKISIRKRTATLKDSTS